jgi:hypothetical protein
MRNLIIALLVFSALSLQAQNVVGYWYGTANVKKWRFCQQLPGRTYS